LEGGRLRLYTAERFARDLLASSHAMRTATTTTICAGGRHNMPNPLQVGL